MKRVSIPFALALTACSFTSNAADWTEAAQAQQKALDTQSQEDALYEKVKSIEQSVKEKISTLNYELFKEARQAGIQVEPTQRGVDDLNRQQENSGVWGYSVKNYENGYFSVLTDSLTGTYDSAFSVKGYGLVIASGYIRDNRLNDSGEFSSDCQVEVYIGRHSEKFNCTEFYNGTIDKEVINSMKEMLTKEIKEKGDV